MLAGGRSCLSVAENAVPAMHSKEKRSQMRPVVERP